MKDEKYFKAKIQNTIENLEQTQENLETDMYAIECNNWYGERCNGMSDGIEIAIEMLREIIKEHSCNSEITSIE